MYYMGIDWADQKYDIVILDEQGKYASPKFEIDKSDEDYNRLLSKMRQLSANPTDFKIGIETPHNLIVDFLLMWGYEVYCIHPISMKSFRKRYRTTNARDDAHDAYVIADVARTDTACWEKVHRGSELTHQIRILTADHLHLTQQHTMANNTFRQTLKDYYPEYIKFFKDVSCPTSLAFLKAYPNFDAAKKLTHQQLTQFFKEQMFLNTKKINHIYQLLQHSHIIVPSPIIKCKTMKMFIYLKQLIELNKSCDQYLQLIKQLAANHPDFDIFLSFPGAGELTAARLIALFGDKRQLYPDASIIQAKAGTCPVTEETGKDKKRKKVHKVIYFREGCNKVYRTFVHHLAFASLTKSQWCKAYYDKHRAMGKDSHHALRCLGNLQLKILFAMWKNRTKYDENIFLAQRTRHLLNEQKKAA